MCIDIIGKAYCCFSIISGCILSYSAARQADQATRTLAGGSSGQCEEENIQSNFYKGFTQIFSLQSEAEKV